MPKPYPLECTACKRKYLKWQGICPCGKSNTIEPIKKETLENRRVRRRWKGSERGIARRMQTVDGPDPALKAITSSTGRTGHITGIRVDAISNHYVIENKNTNLPKWLIDAWVLIQQRGFDFNKHPLLHLDPPNMPKTLPIQGVKVKTETLAIITQNRHEDLIRTEKALRNVINYLVLDAKYESLIQEVNDILNGTYNPE